MLKHLVHSHPNKLHTFDDFYRSTSKPIKTRSMQSDGTSSTSSSPSPTSPCSPSNNSYTFYSIFADFKSNSTTDPLPEEDETEVEQPTEEKNDKTDKLPSIPNTPLFYLDEDHPTHSHSSPTSSSSPSHPPTSTHSPSSHWPSLLLNRFRHHPSSVAKQNSLNENQMSSTKLRKSELNDPTTWRNPSTRFLKRSDTIDGTTPPSTEHFNEDFPELSSPTPRTMSSAKKHRSFVSVFHHFPHPHLSSFSSTSQTKSSSNTNKSNSTGTLDATDSLDHPPRPKLVKQKAISSPHDFVSAPVNKSPSTPILPKIASLFHRHHHPHLSEQYKYRVGNLKARLHHRRASPTSSSTTKFQCPNSNDLIDQITNDQPRDFAVDHLIDSTTFRQQRSTKPVIMKRVHTWHNSFNLTPIDQCLEY